MNQITTLHCSQIDRRRFLYGMGAIGIASGLTRNGVAEADNTSPKIKLGIIGCGGRGKFIGELAVEHGGYEIVSPGDYFQDQVNPLGEHFNVPAKGRFTGLHCYKRLLDAVAIMSPPAFHPEQTEVAYRNGEVVTWQQVVDSKEWIELDRSGFKV